MSAQNARGTGGRVNGSKNFSPEKISFLLNTIRGILPVGGNDWENVATAYNQQFNVRF